MSAEAHEWSSAFWAVAELELLSSFAVRRDIAVAPKRPRRRSHLDGRLAPPAAAKDSSGGNGQWVDRGLTFAFSGMILVERSFGMAGWVRVGSCKETVEGGFHGRDASAYNRRDTSASLPCVCPHRRQLRGGLP